MNNPGDQGYESRGPEGLDRDLGRGPRGFSQLSILISLLVTVAIAVGVVFGVILLRGGDEGVPASELPPANVVPNSTEIPATSTPTTVPASPTRPEILLAPGAIQQLLSPNRSATLVSPDNRVTISVESGAVSAPVVLVYIPLANNQLPLLPDGFSATGVSFDLTPLNADGSRLDDLEFNSPATIAISLSDDLVRVARGEPERVSVHHFKTSEGQ